MPFSKPSEVARLALMAVQYREQVGEALRARRQQLGLTQSQVADRVETYLRKRGKRDEGKPFDAQNISRWERGKNLGTTDNLEAVAAALETTVAAIMATIEREPKRPALPVNGNGPSEPAYVQELRHELQDVKTMLKDLGTALDAVSEASAARSEQSDSKLEELLHGLGLLLRRAS